ncbi:hypothetical protein EJB05_22880, partial [Eragrostis curvula]
MSDVISRRVQTSPTSLAHLPEDIQAEILLHLPSPHHNLLRASQVCGLWRRLVRNPAFLHSFRERRNGTPPLIGVFHDRSFSSNRRFTPVDEDSTATGMFRCSTSWRILDCRHGRVLFLNDEASAGGALLLVWDPMAGGFNVINMPTDWTACHHDELNGAVVCTAGDDDEGRHGDCRASPYLVVLLAGRAPWALVSIYSSVAREWSEPIWYDGLPMWADVRLQPCVVIGTTLYQPLHANHTLSFDLESRNFNVIPHPLETAWMDVQIMKLDGRTLGLVVADNAAFSLHFWEREQAGHWVLRRTVHLDILEPLSAAAATSHGPGNFRSVKLLGACEHGNVIFLEKGISVFLFYLDSLKLKKILFGDAIPLGTLSPYESFYAPR